MKKLIKILSVALVALTVTATALSLAACPKDPYVAPEYTIIYELDGGVNHPDNPDKFFASNPPTIKEATKANFEFEGWTSGINQAPQRTVEIPQGTKENLTFTANWLVIEVPAEGFSIKYLLSNGVNHASNPAEGNYTDDDLPIVIQPATREDYNFKGWTCAGLQVTTPAQTIDIPAETEGALVFVANWEVKPIVPVEEPANYGAGKRKAPALKMFDLDENEYNLSDYYGIKPVLITIWKWNCPACIEEMKDVFGPVYEELSAKFEILAIHRDSEVELRKFINNNNYQFPMITDEGKSIEKTSYGTGLTPTNYMVDRFGYLYRPGASGNSVSNYDLTTIKSISEFKTILNGAIDRAKI